MSPDEYSAFGGENLGSPLKRILWPIAYVCAACLLFKYHKLSLKIVKSVPSLVLLLGYITCSVFWSETRIFSIISVAALLGNTLIGLYIGVRYGVTEFLRLLGWVFGIVAVATLLARVVIGAQALQEEGFWIGFFANKNALGMNMSVGALVFFALARQSKRKWLYICFCATCFILVLLAQAMTCVVVLFVLASTMVCRFFARQLSSRLSRICFISMVLACSMTFVISHDQDILSALGKSPDLTGRVEVWSVLAGMIRDRPLLGYGYGGFWVFGGPAQTVWETLGRNPNDVTHGHNGYLELIVECGVIGLVFLLLFLFAFAKRAWQFWLSTGNIWPTSLIVFLCFYNLGDATFAARNNICWLILVSVITQLVHRCPIKRAEAGLKAVCRARIPVAQV